MGILLDWIQHAELHGKYARGLIIRKSFPELEDFHVNKASMVLPELGWRYMASRRSWMHPNGAILRLGFIETMEDYWKYHGAEINWLCYEELTTWKDPAPLDMLRGSLRSPHGVPVRMVATGNPGGAGDSWVKERYIDPAPPYTPFKDPKSGQYRVFIPSTMADNPLLLENDPEYVERLKSAGPPHIVRAWLLGDWTISATGNVFLREWWKYYRWNPELSIMPKIGLVTEVPPIIRIIQSWDTGFKTKSKSDPSCCTTWGVSHTDYYLLDCLVIKAGFPALVQAAKMQGYKWNPHMVLIEDQASGQSLYQTLRAETNLPIKAVGTDSDKLARANAVSPLVSSGRVWLPENAPWVADYVEEMSSFPLGAHDDRVDSSTQALAYLSETRRKEREMEQRRQRTRPWSIYGR